MNAVSRRKFLTEVGQGMLLASVGSSLALDMGLSPAWGDEAAKPVPLTFGDYEPLVALMQETPADRLIPALVEKLNSGVELKTLIAAGALANARTFGGQDYIGFHSFMALMPALQMSREMPAARRRCRC